MFRTRYARQVTSGESPPPPVMVKVSEDAPPVMVSAVVMLFSAAVTVIAALDAEALTVSLPVWGHCKGIGSTSAYSDCSTGAVCYRRNPASSIRSQGQSHGVGAVAMSQRWTGW